ncbi:integrase catalytic domain-containing protein [Trichonephila clavata]|uniref:Integrase catalytic domain-containing protein n=1 Tax=Trichonephila clavata TaxID=2740835 RepID=A0A8X6GLC8_TRICU|nr:integrase catalytic domain-containing protein [Trichonephila clavata]
MEITSLNRLRGPLKAKVKKGELFGTGSEQSPSLLEVKLQLNNISTLRDKIESLRKDYYSLPADVDLSETENELEQLEDRLDKTEHDTFEFSVSDPANNSVWTKRTILSHIARIFDPMGLLGPVIVMAKLFMETLWLVKRDWDQPLLEIEIRNWKKFVFSLKALQGIKVQRFVLIENYKSLELHGFSDASEKAFGAAIYLRCTNSSEQSSMMLLCSKRRIAPIKLISIPRL